LGAPRVIEQADDDGAVAEGRNEGEAP
jgi:hypothetical protein